MYDVTIKFTYKAREILVQVEVPDVELKAYPKTYNSFHTLRHEGEAWRQLYDWLVLHNMPKKELWDFSTNIQGTPLSYEEIKDNMRKVKR